MKTIQIFLITFIFTSMGFVVDAQVKSKNFPDSKFNVHRQYDDKGNLIEYDSTSVTTWNSDSSGKFISPNGQTDSIFQGSSEDQILNQFGMSDDFFSPFPDLRNLLKNLNPSDSSSFNGIFNNDSSVFRFDFGLSPLDENFEKRIHEMNSEMQKYFNGQMEKSKKDQKGMKQDSIFIEPERKSKPSEDENSNSTNI